MACFWIGTSGWHYSHWRGDFYPRDMSPREWLSHYFNNDAEGYAIANARSLSDLLGAERLSASGA